MNPSKIIPHKFQGCTLFRKQSHCPAHGTVKNPGRIVGTGAKENFELPCVLSAGSAARRDAKGIDLVEPLSLRVVVAEHPEFMLGE
ncbi:hypothetical protein, partial [Burkholderia sp. SIMBA_062]|uniref:hypothetical protein n=1 Tax=Burkholderia sp. SIMBA_062 TaxID=3085803 RepID=UPI00397CAED5